MTDQAIMTPVLRSFDEAKAREFYVDFLGAEVAFTHRHTDDLPLYMGLKLFGAELHISEHFGDASPGAHVRILTPGIDDYIAGLAAKKYKHARPGAPQEMPWGTKEITIGDPFGNRLTFWSEESAP